MKLRFKLDADNNRYNVLARRKDTGKWEKIGICHLAAVGAVKQGRLDLIQFQTSKRTAQ
jgi:hypothetical protein